MRGNVQSRSKGTYRIRYDAPDSTLGSRKQVTETIRGNRKDAERILRERLAAVENGSFVPKTAETVSEFLQRWLDTYAATNTTLRTQQGYRGHIRRYVEPMIGSGRLQDLRPSHIQGIYAGMLERGLSPRTCLHVHRVLRESLSHAVRWGLLVKNPAEVVDPPRTEAREIKMWDVQTINRFLTASSDSPFGDLYHLAVLTGMRRSEICGLTWEHVDLDSARLSVVATLQRIVGKGLVVGKPKNAKSRRSIALSLGTVSLLRSVHAAQLRQRLAVGSAWSDTGYVFTQPDGTPIDPDRVSRAFAREVRRTDLPHLTFHGLRHAHATLMLTSGVHAKIVSERLGHSNIGITMDLYSHVLPGLQEAAVLALDEQLAR